MSLFTKHRKLVPWLAGVKLYMDVTSMPRSLIHGYYWLVSKLFIKNLLSVVINRNSYRINIILKFLPLTIGSASVGSTSSIF